MKKDVFTFLISGKAGEGVKKASTSTDEITSHYMRANAVQDGEGLGIPISSEAKKYPNPDPRVGVSAVAVLSVAIGLDKGGLSALIEKEYPSDVGNKFPLNAGKQGRVVLTGNEAVVGGLDIYIAYPMTQSASILHYLGTHSKDLGIVVLHPENEIAVINMALGASFAGARVMVSSRGGGFALMEEAFSLAGMTETPLLCILASRPGQSTGVPTYTEQEELRFALSRGHGEFLRIVASPGSVEEAFYLTVEMLRLVWQFQTPAILLTEKHLSESGMNVDTSLERASQPEPVMHASGEYKIYADTDDGISPLLFPPLKGLIKWCAQSTLMALTIM